MKRFLIILLCLMPLFANAYDFKPVVKEYSTPKDISKYPLENRVNPNLVIFTPVPKVIYPGNVIYLYDKEKRKFISFSWHDDLTFKNTLEGVFGLKEAAKDDENVNTFTAILKNENVEVFEIKINNNTLSRVFALIYKVDENLYKYDIYILPNKTTDIVRMISLYKYSKNEAEEILGTLQFIEN